MNMAFFNGLLGCLNGLVSLQVLGIASYYEHLDFLNSAIFMGISVERHLLACASVCMLKCMNIVEDN